MNLLESFEYIDQRSTNNAHELKIDHTQQPSEISTQRQTHTDEIEVQFDMHAYQL